jgi:hypothetical protein
MNYLKVSWSIIMGELHWEKKPAIVWSCLMIDDVRQPTSEKFSCWVQVVRLVDELAVVTMGSNDGCLSNFTLVQTILIYIGVKDLILGHLNLILGPRSFSNHRLDFKILTLHQIKMTQKWINVVDTRSNKVQTMLFWCAKVFRLPDVFIVVRPVNAETEFIIMHVVQHQTACRLSYYASYMHGNGISGILITILGAIWYW